MIALSIAWLQLAPAVDVAIVVLTADDAVVATAGALTGAWPTLLAAADSCPSVDAL